MTRIWIVLFFLGLCCCGAEEESECDGGQVNDAGECVEDRGPCDGGNFLIFYDVDDVPVVNCFND